MEWFIRNAWAAEDQVNMAVNTGAWHAITSASPVVQITLLILVAMSIVSWAIAFSKRSQFQSSEESNEPFMNVFWKANSLEDIYESVANHPESSMARVFKAGYLELRKIAESNLATDDAEKQRPLLSGLDNLQRALGKAIDNEVSSLEGRLSFLATTGSTCPFIGLFGTVWGIMGAFQKIGATGMASLAVVAPGISEALIATAIGLAAAIPATVTFNHYTTKLRKHELDLNNFASDFLNIAKRNFFKDF